MTTYRTRKTAVHVKKRNEKSLSIAAQKKRPAKLQRKNKQAKQKCKQNWNKEIKHQANNVRKRILQQTQTTAEVRVSFSSGVKPQPFQTKPSAREVSSLTSDPRPFLKPRGIDPQRDKEPVEHANCFRSRHVLRRWCQSLVKFCKRLFPLTD